MADQADSPRASKIRPRADYLRQLPTLDTQTPDSPNVPEDLRALARRHGVDYALELKLETPTARYWLCTRGLSAPRTVPAAEAGGPLPVQLPDGWVEGYVTVEPVPPPAGGLRDCWAYGPEQTPWLQGMDYLDLLREECSRLEVACAYEPRPATERQLEATRAEMRQVVAQLKKMEQTDR
jgi:hypothetical protein